MGRAPRGRVSQAVAIFHRCYAEKLTMEMVASEIGVSVNQLGRLFHRVLGRTPQRCLLLLRGAGGVSAA